MKFTIILVLLLASVNAKLIVPKGKDSLRRAQGTPDGETPAHETGCDYTDEAGTEAHALCVAICEAKDCQPVGKGDTVVNSCEKLKALYVDITGYEVQCFSSKSAKPPARRATKNPTFSPTGCTSKLCGSPSPTENPTKNPSAWKATKKASPTQNPTRNPVASP
jgi:hypothetical protein